MNNQDIALQLQIAEFTRIQNQNHPNKFLLLKDIPDSTIVWAYGFIPSDSIQNPRPVLDHTPTKGRILREPGGISFVPFQKGTTTPIKNRTTPAEFRFYADSETNAWAGYYELVKQAYHQIETYQTNMNIRLRNRIPEYKGKLVIRTNKINFSSDVITKPCSDVCIYLPKYPGLRLYPIYPCPHFDREDPSWYQLNYSLCTANETIRLEVMDTYPDNLQDITKPTIVIPKQETMVYKVLGYDKDADIYDVLYQSNCRQDCTKFLENLISIQRHTDMYRSSCQDPYDWFALDEGETILTYPLI